MSKRQAVRDFVRALVVVGPYNNAHLVAIRVGISTMVPLLILAVVGRHDLAPYAAFGAFASLYGRVHGYRARAGMQLWAGAALTVAVVAGVVVSGLPGRQWWVVVVGALIAAGGSWLSDSLRWHPPGPIFLVFGFAVCAMAGQGLGQVPLAAALSLASAAFAVLVGQAGSLFKPGERGLPIVHRPELLSAVAEGGARRHLARYVIAVTISGLVATLIGVDHTYWAMVAAVATMGGPDLAARLVRGVHRVIGTFVGLGLAAVILFWYPSGFVIVILVGVLSLAVELVIGRNYALGCVFITPLALAMGQLAHEVPVGQLLIDRGWETAFGAAVAMIILVLIPSPRRAKPNTAKPA